MAKTATKSPGTSLSAIAQALAEADIRLQRASKILRDLKEAMEDLELYEAMACFVLTACKSGKKKRIRQLDFD